MVQIDAYAGLRSEVAMKAPVKVATTAEITLSGTQTIDGVSLSAGDRVLVKNQSSAIDNGIWIVATGAWSRAPDFDGNYDVVKGTMVRVASGTVNGGRGFQVTTADPIVIGTSSIAWSQVSVSDIDYAAYLATYQGVFDDAVATATEDAETARDEAVAAAQEAVEASLSFATVGDVELHEFTSVPDYLRVAGYATAGDGGGAIWKNVASEPSHDAWIQSADGSYFVPVLEDGYGRPAWFGDGFAGLKKVWGLTKKVILTPGADYTFTETLSSAGVDAHVKGQQSVLIRNYAGPMFDLRGGWSDIQAVSAFNGDNVTVTDASAYERGDLVRIVSEEAHPFFPTNAKKGEFLHVRMKDDGTDVVTFSAPALWSYDTGQTCRIGKLSRVKIKVDGVILDEQDKSKTAEDAYSANFQIMIADAVEPEVDVEVRFSYDAAVWLGSCYGARSRMRIDFAPNQADTSEYTGHTGYGFLYQNCEHCLTYDSFFGDIRHGVVYQGSVHAKTPGGLSEYGLCAHNRTVDCTALGASSGAYDTHHGAWDCEFHNCVSIGARRHGFSFRGVDNRAVGCTSIGDLYAFMVFVQSAYTGSAKTDRTSWIDGKIIDPREHAGLINGGANRVNVQGGRIFLSAERAHADLADIFYAVDSSADLRIRGDVQIEFDGDISGVDAIFRFANGGNIDINGLSFRGTSGATSPNKPLILNDAGTLLVYADDIYVNTPGVYLSHFTKGALNTTSQFGYIQLNSSSIVLNDNKSDETLRSDQILQGPLFKNRGTPVGNVTGRRLSNANGQYKLDPSGVIEQWGTLELVYASDSTLLATWTFPVAFTSSGYGGVFVLAQRNNNTSNVAATVAYYIDHTAPTTTQVTIRASSDAGFTAGDKISLNVYARGT